MKKQTQKMIMTLIIVFLLAMSTIAFVVISSVSPEESSQNTLQLPDKQVMDGYINESYRQTYLSQGFTLMEYHYYAGCCKDIGPFIDYLPEVIGTQLIIQKINDTEYYINLESGLGSEEKITPKDNKELLLSLCNVLTRTPIDCGIITIEQNSSKSNISS